MGTRDPILTTEEGGLFGAIALNAKLGVAWRDLFDGLSAHIELLATTSSPSHFVTHHCLFFLSTNFSSLNLAA